eukprot:g2619.t1
MQNEDNSKQDVLDKVDVRSLEIEQLQKLVLSLHAENRKLALVNQVEIAKLKKQLSGQKSIKPSEQERNLVQESLEPQINAEIDNQPSNEETEVETEKNITGKKDAKLAIVVENAVNSNMKWNLQARNFFAWLLCSFAIGLTILNGVLGYWTDHGSLGILPVILYFAFQILGAFEDERTSNQMYMEHTPWCMYSPTREPFYIHNIPFVGCDPVLDRRDGLMDIAVWSNSTHPLNRSIAVKLVQKMKANESFYMSFINSSNYNSRALSQHDYTRFAAMDLYKNYVLPNIWPNVIQGAAVVLSVSFGKVFLRVSRLSFADVVTFKITFWESIASVNYAILIATAFMFTSFSNEQVGNLMLPLVATAIFSASICYVALWRICVQVSSELEKKKSSRGVKRTSIVPSFR